MRCSKCNQNKSSDQFYEKRTEKRTSSICKQCFNKYCVERWIQRKLEAIQYLGGKCKDCSGVFHHAVFEFHHRDPTQKDFDWSKLRKRSRSAITDELDKCDLLCANCHRLRHALVV